ncbi:NIC-domain-containing protein [Teratosphaeria nubilosa]|uniref:NIC-domain-containing protein n=1 Tax=Teratosphaeria nubilosa TaxID=161662 RepID=A0A6G1KVN9_9PEZI|nr:NIC-domain-containing protein [Teratosphaeria nubilosa]
MSSLFGAAPGASNTTHSLGGSVFGTAASNNGSLFGNNIVPDERPSTLKRSFAHAGPPEPSYHQHLLNKSSKNAIDDNGGLGRLQLGLGDISNKVRNIGQGSPSALLDPDALLRSNTRLNSGSDHARSQAFGGDRNSKLRASFVLAKSGINVSQSLRDVEELSNSTYARAPPADAVPDFGASSGVRDYLGVQHQNSFQQMIDSTVQRAKDEFNGMIDEQLHDVDWHAHRQRIYEHFGLRKLTEIDAEGGAGRETASFGRSSRRSRLNATLGQSRSLHGLTKSVIGAPGLRNGRQSTFNDVEEKLPADGMRPAPEDRALRKKQDSYAGKVKDLNVARIQETVFPIMTRFAEVEDEPSNDDTSMLINAYKALVHVTGEDPTKENLAEPGVIRERQYSVDYLDDNHSSKGSIAVRKRIINGSRTFLEKNFLAQMDALLDKHRTVAMVGGFPTAVAKARGYVRVRAARKELGPDLDLLQVLTKPSAEGSQNNESDYCWAVIFYLLRSGLLDEAKQYVNDNAAQFKQIDRNFPKYLKAYVDDPDHRLTGDLQRAIDNEYSQRSRLAADNTLDPYRMLCYKVIGRCEVSHRNLDTITNDMNDWLWLQFVLTREYNRAEEMAHEAFGLDELRASIKQIGERYFGPTSDITNAPTTLFFMQILAGMFEKAVADLYPHNYVSATHFAIALDFYGLLRVSGDLTKDDLLTYTTRQQPQIAFGSMIGLYTRDFRTANPEAAVDYLCLICLNADLSGELGKTQRELCHQALVEVTLETREFATLIGDIKSNGYRIPGAIENRLKLVRLDNKEHFLKQITLSAARVAEEQSRVTDAALLYHLAEDFNKVVNVVSSAVSVALTTELGEQPARVTPLKPRSTSQETSEEVPGSSFSLTAVDDPITLARNMRDLYRSNATAQQKITQTSWEVCNILLMLADARKAFDAGEWAACIDYISNTRVLPTDSHGDINEIKAKAQAFDQMPTNVARTVGHVMLWTVTAAVYLGEKMKHAEFDTGMHRGMVENCKRIAEDVNLFAGLIRFKLPGRVWETLARASEELGL